MRGRFPEVGLEEDDESLVDRSVSFLRDLSQRLRAQAGRRWKVTHLNVDLSILRRRRRRWMQLLGEACYDMMSRGAIEPDDLHEYGDEIRAIERQMTETAEHLAALEEDAEEAIQEATSSENGLPAAATRARAARSRRRDGRPAALPAAGDPLPRAGEETPPYGVG